MKTRTTLFVAAAGLVAASVTPTLAHAWRGAGAQDPQESVPLRRGEAPLVPQEDLQRPDDGARPLAPVAPRGDAAEARPRLDVADLLTERDLDTREQNFDTVVQRAAVDDDVRAELRALADGGDADLAWTARLALRAVQNEAPASRGRALQRAPFGGGDPFADLERRMDELFQGGFSQDPFELLERFRGAAPFDDPAFGGFGLHPRRLAPRGGSQDDAQRAQPTDPFDELRARMNELQRQLDGVRGGSNAGPLTPPATRGGQGGFSTFQGRSQSMTVGPDGVRVEVTEDGPDGRTTRKYEAKTLEELYQMHPELKGR